MNESFVVGLNRAEVLRRRAIVRRTRQIGGAVTLFLSAICVGLAIGLAAGFPEYWPFAVLIAVSMLPVALPTLKSLNASAQLKRWYDANDLPPFAFRMTPAALELGVEGAPAPVVLPWPAVIGLRQQRKFGQPILEVVLQQGVTPTSPGVSGLDQPAARATLQPSKWIKTAGFYGVASLDQPVEAMDQALRHFSQGQAALG
ncbi:hypothetical protein EV652_107304 [Kribbella steppae]|uniref:Uncharacterized protein n=1 Tax=Kribbella steppae TaxID=2512223 RepID=A0A4R2HDK9_9ACTN|nr:hypothetical protein [Kribbella steppae]TCO26412.1 hypothetical protein EV652_107304 [Kribbella steppae]